MQRKTLYSILGVDAKPLSTEFGLLNLPSKLYIAIMHSVMEPSLQKTNLKFTASSNSTSWKFCWLHWVQFYSEVGTGFLLSCDNQYRKEQSHYREVPRWGVSNEARHNWKCFLAYEKFKVFFLISYIFDISKCATNCII